jgi:crotonobetainyl-CoA:carnitine CoA-transferase CaiB-like acyl-CoA transferase
VTAADAPLDDLCVAEHGDGLAPAFAGSLLAGLGARVERERPSRFPILDRRKAARGAAAVGAVVHDERGAPDVGGDPIRCAVRAWGARGPRTALPPDEALVQAATGVHAMQWSWSGRPVWLVTPVVSYMTGVLAALGVAAAHLARLRGGRAQRVAVSGLQGALLLNSGTYVTGPGSRGSLTVGGDPRGVYPTYSIYPTADGWLFVGALTQAFWVKLMTFFERPDLLADARLQGNPLTFGAPELRALVRGALEPLFARRTTDDWVRRLRDADIPCGPVRTRAGCLADPETRAAGLVAEPWEPPPPARFVAGTRGAVGRPAGAPRACLEGVRVVDLTSFIAGPVCPMLLADLGADVVKVESADGDPFRMTAYGFHGWNRGKRSLVLDLKRREGRDVLLDLARGADVVVENFRGGVMERLGIGWATLDAARPGVVLVSISGYGTEGPLAALPGFDPVFQARSGFMAAQGGADGPVFHTIAYNDYSAGALGALATVAALAARERTGRGGRVDLSLLRTALVAQSAHMTDTSVGGRDFVGPRAARRLYQCGDGWLCVAAGDDGQARALGALAGTSLATDTPADGAPAAAVAAALADRARADALARLAAAGVPAAPCLGFPELVADEHVVANRAFVTLEDPRLGPVTLPGPFVDLEATPVPVDRLGPALGADGRRVLGEVGYDEARIGALVAAGVTRG